jgi:glycosyltransferase involved in cell wall biosynthesis
VRVLAFAENDADVEAIQELERRGCEIIAPRISPTWRRRLSARHLLGKQPITLPYFRHPELDQAMARWVHETRPDLVFGYSSSMGQYILRQLPALEGVPKVMQFAELDSDKWRQYAASSGALGRWVYGREARLLLEFERELARQMDLNFVVSDIERELFEREIPGAPCAVLTNGVDLEAFRPAEEDAREPHTLIFTGVMDYRPTSTPCSASSRASGPRCAKSGRTPASWSWARTSPRAEVLARQGRHRNQRLGPFDPPLVRPR